MPNETPNLIQWLTGGGALALLGELLRQRRNRKDEQWVRLNKEREARADAKAKEYIAKGGNTALMCITGITVFFLLMISIH